MKVLELFAGTASFSKVATARGHDCRTVEIDPRFSPTYCKDIMDFTVRDLGDWRPDIIWASPPCQKFSVMTIYRNWEKLEDGSRIPKNEQVLRSIGWVRKAIDLIRELQPAYYFIENPRAMLRKMSFMGGSDRRTVTYCKYGTPYQKATDIWTNCESWVSRPVCSNGDPCHARASRGSKLGLQGVGARDDRVVVPAPLCEEILMACEKRPEGYPMKRRSSLHPGDMGGGESHRDPMERGKVPVQLCLEIIEACEKVEP